MKPNGQVNTEKIVSDYLKAQSEKMDTILHDAFKKHFGFSIECAKKDKLEQAFIEGLDGVVAIKYCGETFLFMEWPAKFEIEHDENGYSIKTVLKYKEV